MIVSVALLLCAALLLFACYNDDFYEKYGEPQTLSKVRAFDPAAPADLNDQTTDKEDVPSKDQEATEGESETHDDPPVKENDPATENTQQTDLENAEISEQNGTNTTDATVQEEEQDGGPAQEQVEEEEEKDNDLSTETEVDSDPFDLAKEKEGMYRYLRFDDPAEGLVVYVWTESVGIATVRADASMTLDCGFVQTDYPLWGNLDENGRMTYYLWFELLGGFRQVEFSPMAVQLDLTVEEVAVLRAAPDDPTQDASTDTPSSDPEPDAGKESTDPAADQTKTEQGSNTDTTTEQINGQDDASNQPTGGTDEHVEESPVADLSALSQSVIYSLWEGLYGVVEEVSVDFLNETGESYRFSLTELTQEDRAALIARLEPFTYREEGANAVYNVERAIEGAIINLSLNITSGEQGYRAAVNVTVVFLSED